MSAKDDLIDWNGRWQISKGIISCRKCLAQQLESQGADDFLHLPGCGLHGQRHTPWKDLLDITKKIQSY